MLTCAVKNLTLRAGSARLNLINLNDLSAQDIFSIWDLAQQKPLLSSANIGWSFEGNGIRTRTTFIQAFRELGLTYIELPNLLKTSERACDLAEYLDPFYSLYVIRESSHERLTAFANASKRPVINAMSSRGHPCEVLCDAFYIHSRFGDIRNVRIGLWGPTTNVLSSWHQLAAVLGVEIQHFCGTEFHELTPQVCFSTVDDGQVDVLITDSWPADYSDPAWSLTEAVLSSLGNPVLLPTPPFCIGEELDFDPRGYPGFAGYQQKSLLLPVQRAILTYAMQV
jgi:ornithine carbamoyltransferase